MCMYLAAILFLSLLWAFPGCAPIYLYPKDFVNFSRYHDGPIPPDVAPWLKSGRQSRVTPLIKAIASKLYAKTRRERLYNAVQYVWSNMHFDRWYNSRMFTLTADQLFRQKVLGGCSDFALVQAVLFRALGIPARLVVTANVDWMLRYQKNPLYLTTGHVYIEVFLENKWFLVDSTYRVFFSDYDPTRKSYPRREYLCMKGTDYWEMGLTTVRSFIDKAGALARRFHEDQYKAPGYPQHKI